MGWENDYHSCFESVWFHFKNPLKRNLKFMNIYERVHSARVLIKFSMTLPVHCGTYIVQELCN